jgi:hypothetical protein
MARFGMVLFPFAFSSHSITEPFQPPCTSEFEGQQDQSNNHYESTDDNCYRRISLVQLRKEAPEIYQDPPWTYLCRRANDSPYEQEHDDAESNGCQTQEDYDTTIEDIHRLMVFL